LNLIKTSFFTAIITFVRISAGFVSGKIIALYTGPAGVALVGAFSNFISIVLTLGNGAISNGVIKYVAQYNKDNEKTSRLISTSLRITFYSSIVVSTFILFFASYFSKVILGNREYVNVIIVLGITLIFYSLNSLIIAILNGKGEIKKYTLANAIGSVISLLLTILLVMYYKVTGALYSIVLSQVIVFVFTVFLVRKSGIISKKIVFEKFDRKLGLNLSHFSLMALVSALTVPVSQILLRNIISHDLGINAAGYWQAMMRVSDGYLMLITTSLSVYYLPKLSSLVTNSEIRTEVLNGYKIILPSVLIGCITMYFSRFYVIEVLFSKKFLHMESLFFWQLIGDFFKMASWILSFLMLAKAKTTVYIITEIGFSALYVTLSYFFIHKFGIQGATISFALNYVLYLLVMIVIFRNLLFKKNIIL
jgi:O-antigen/teichoic acid export membrane protein